MSHQLFDKVSSQGTKVEYAEEFMLAAKERPPRNRHIRLCEMDP